MISDETNTLFCRVMRLPDKYLQNTFDYAGEKVYHNYICIYCRNN